MADWIKTGALSQVLDAEDFYVSHNSNPDNQLDAFLMPAEYRGTPETALVLKNQPDKLFGCRFFVLYGDFRKQYEAVFAHGFDACYAVFLANIEKMAHTSDTPLNANN